jgi:hypothetical protein
MITAARLNGITHVKDQDVLLLKQDEVLVFHNKQFDPVHTVIHQISGHITYTLEKSCGEWAPVPLGLQIRHRIKGDNALFVINVRANVKTRIRSKIPVLELEAKWCPNANRVGRVPAFGYYGNPAEPHPFVARSCIYVIPNLLSEGRE